MIPMGRIQLLQQNTITDYSQGENGMEDRKIYISQLEEANEDCINRAELSIICSAEQVTRKHGEKIALIIFALKSEMCCMCERISKS